MNIGKTQLKASLLVEKDFQLKNKKNEESAKNSFVYYALWGNCIGFEKLKFNLFGKKKLFNFSKVYLKDLFSLCFGNDYEIYNFDKNIKRKILLISSATKLNFDADGSYNDRYFKINSKNFKQITFYVDYLDINLPSKIDENIVLFKLKNTSLLSGVIFLIKYLAKNLKKIDNLKNFFSRLSCQSIRAENLFKKINLNEDIRNFERLIFPYEGQPFQQHMINESKKINKKLITLGYDHSAPHSLPFHLYHREGAPDLLFVNGESQIDHLIQFQNWPKEKIKLIPTLRYQNISQSEFSNKIFLPYQIFNSNIVLDELEDLLKKAKPKSFNIIDIKTHPVAVNLISQKNLKLNIEELFKKYSSKFDENNQAEKISFFIGPTTGVIVALEKNLKVIHICFEPIFDSYSSELWPNLNIKQITANSLEYSLVKKNSFILFENDKNLFKSNFIDK